MDSGQAQGGGTAVNKSEQILLMQKGSVSAALWKLGLPTMLGMLISALYNVVDGFFVSRLGSSPMAGVSVAFPLILLLVGIGMTFGCGAASYVSRLLGAGQRQLANRVASTALYSGMAAGGIFMLLVFYFLEPVLFLLGASETTLPYAMQFTKVFMLAAVFNTFNLIVDQLAAAEGITRIPMLAMILGSVLNMLLNPLFIYQMGLGVSGSAWASVVSILATSLFFWRFIFSRQGVLTYDLSCFAPSSAIFREILKIGIPMFVSQFLQSTTLGLMNIVAAVYGDAAVAAAGAVNRILPLGFFVVFGFLRGYGPFAGYNYGARQYGRLQAATHTALCWTTAFCALAAGCLLLFPTRIMAPFSAGNGEALQIGADMLWANGLGFLVFGFEMVYMTLFLSIGNGAAGGILSVSLQGVFCIPLLLVLPHFWGLAGLIWAYPMAHYLNAFLTMILKVKVLKNIAPRMDGLFHLAAGRPQKERAPRSHYE